MSHSSHKRAGQPVDRLEKQKTAGPLLLLLLLLIVGHEYVSKESGGSLRGRGKKKWEVMI